MKTLDEIVTDFRAVQSLLLFKRAELFPFGCVVMVQCQKYSGFGIVSEREEAIKPDDIAVRLENGNCQSEIVSEFSFLSNADRVQATNVEPF